MTIKKLAVLALALGIAAVSLTGCVTGKETSVAATYNGGEIPAGVYIFHQVNAINEAYNKVANPYDDLMSQTVDGVAFEQWVNDRALKLVKIHAATASEAARLNINLDEVTAASIKQSIATTWKSESASMEKAGISLASAEAVALNSQLINEVFMAYYGEGGEKAVSESELKAFFKENYRRSLMLVLSKNNTQTGLPLNEEQLAEQKKLFEDYKTKVQSGTPLFDVIVEEDNRLAALAGNTAERKPLVEAEQEVLVNKNNTAYPSGLLSDIFASTKLGTPEFYEDDNYFVIYELRDTEGDGTAFTNAKATLLNVYKGEEFQNAMIALADSVGFTENTNATKKFKVSTLLGI